MGRIWPRRGLVHWKVEVRRGDDESALQATNKRTRPAAHQPTLSSAHSCASPTTIRVPSVAPGCDCTTDEVLAEIPTLDPDKDHSIQSHSITVKAQLPVAALSVPKILNHVVGRGIGSVHHRFLLSSQYCNTGTFKLPF